MSKLITAIAIVAITIFAVAITKAEEQCPEGQVMRGACVEITNDPNGDTLTDEVAKKNETPNTNLQRSDINQDGKIDIVDLSILLHYWGQTD